MPIDREKLDKAIAAAKAEITEDIRKGVVPETVGSFAELHDHVDANEYGGEMVDRIYDDAGLDAGCDFLNRLQDELDRWLKKTVFFRRQMIRAKQKADAVVAANTEPLDINRKNSVMHGILKGE